MNELGELDRLYYEGGESTLDLTEHGVSFSSQVIAAALENIYRRKYDPDHELDAGIYHETVDILNRAAATGLSDAIQTGVKMPSNAFLTAIKSNVRVFSAFRTHRMQNDIAALMTDKEGNLRSFSAFSKLALQYTDHKNKAWLRTEYDTAVLRAHQAADWQQFEAEKDVLPNLEWMPSTSPNPGADHQPFWGTILPIDDPFWNEHRPGDRWNCKCELRNTDKGTTDTPHSTNPTDQPARGLDCNPGVNGELFSDSHPYIPNECGTCPFGDARLLALAAGKKGNCAKCNALAEATDVETEQQRRVRIEKLKAAREKARESVPANTYESREEILPNIHTGCLFNNRKGLMSLIYHAQTEAEIETAFSVVEHIGDLQYVRSSYLGEGKSYQSPEDRANIQRKIDRGVVQYNIYSYQYKGRRWMIKTEQQIDGKEYLYSFTKKP